jgi:ubiquinone/menaquinone biosynthesis C-methylase UbiE
MTTMSDRYDRAAERYDRWWGPVLAPTALRLLDVVEPFVESRPGARILDVGAGTGLLALAAVRRWPQVRVTALDASAGMLGMARGEADRTLAPTDRSRIDFVVAAADRLPFEDRSFDLVISSFVYQLVPNRRWALDDARRVLAVGGRLAWLTWMIEDGRFAPDEAFDRAYDEAAIDDDEPPAEEDYRSGDVVSTAAVSAQMRRVGFRDVSARRWSLEHAWTAESYLDFVTQYDEVDLFDGLEPAARERLLAATRRELARLRPEDFSWRVPVAFVTGRRD